ncbi:MAG: D-TA family PLP-dependent enzyme [Planctomycetaceae bacterium]|nr:D-TA family PLP-dependent enzyme [Planctomycetaceae bacterium]
MQFQIPEVPLAVLDQIPSPALVVFRDRVVANIESMIRVAGDPARLRPHCKTHKMSAVVRMLIDRGVHKHKAATIAEVEMLFDAGARDVLLAYNPVGPNIGRIVKLAEKFRDRTLSVNCDDEGPLRSLSAASDQSGITIGVFLDLNVGQNRTGVSPLSQKAKDLYALIRGLPGIQPRGFHVYDGHQRDADIEQRRAAVQEVWGPVLELRSHCETAGFPVAAMVCGGTPTFPVYASMTDDGIELSPGTCVFHDAGYGSHFPDLPFTPAAAVLSRVVSRPAPDLATLDVGNKAIAADPPRGQRVYLPAAPDAQQGAHNEEHLVLQSDSLSAMQPGDHVWAIPVHICPTSALYDHVVVIEDGQLVDDWPVTSRNRKLTI